MLPVAASCAQWAFEGSQLDVAFAGSAVSRLDDHCLGGAAMFTPYFGCL